MGTIGNALCYDSIGSLCVVNPIPANVLRRIFAYGSGELRTFVVLRVFSGNF